LFRAAGVIRLFLNNQLAGVAQAQFRSTPSVVLRPTSRTSTATAISIFERARQNGRLILKAPRRAFVVDFDGDGIPDFLGGAEDGRFYYLKNPRAK